MNFEWTERAFQSLTSIEQYVSDLAGETASKRLTNRILIKAKTLVDFPHLGRMVPRLFDPRVREVIEGSYRIIYELDSNKDPSHIYIMGVIHNSQMLENTLFSDLFDE